MERDDLTPEQEETLHGPISINHLKLLSSLSGENWDSLSHTQKLLRATMASYGRLSAVVNQITKTDPPEFMFLPLVLEASHELLADLDPVFEELESDLYSKGFQEGVNTSIDGL